MIECIFKKNSKSIDKIIQRRITRNFIDIFILSEVSKSPLSGYDIMTIIYKRFNLLISPGTIYSTLYSLERDGLIRGENRRRKRVYTLTHKGEKFVRSILAMRDEIESLLLKMFGCSSPLRHENIL